MKIRSLWVAAFILMLSFSSCSKSDFYVSDNNLEVEDDDLSTDDSRIEVKIRGEFKGMSSSNGVTTRITGNSWDIGDAIGVYMKKAGDKLNQNSLALNVKYTTEGAIDFVNSSSEKIYFPYKKENVDFISYYPYTANIIDFIYEVDVTNQNDLSNIDLMYANNVTEVNSSSKIINLDFKHQLTKVVINFKDVLTAEDIESLNFKITNVNTLASFCLSDKILTVNENIASDVSFYINKDNKRAEAILLPTNDLTNNVFIIELGGVTYSYPLVNSVDIKSFSPSTKCVYNITLESNADRVLQEVTAEITDWITVSEDITATENDDNYVHPEPPLSIGDGTKENPYSINQILEGGNQNTKGIWIEGYIVGYYNPREEFEKAFQFGKPTLTNVNNFAIADLIDEKSYNFTLPVYVDSNKYNGNFRDALNLHKNDNLGKKILILGNLDEWNNGMAHITPRNSITILSEVFLDGVKL